jgi:hypothetical protein
MEKTEAKKSRATVPLKVTILLMTNDKLLYSLIFLCALLIVKIFYIYFSNW